MTKIIRFLLKFPLTILFFLMILSGILCLGWISVQDLDWDALDSIKPYENQGVISEESLMKLPLHAQSLLSMAEEKSYQSAYDYVLSHEQNNAFFYRLIVFLGSSALFVIFLLRRLFLYYARKTQK